MAYDRYNKSKNYIHITLDLLVESNDNILAQTLRAKLADAAASLEALTPSSNITRSNYNCRYLTGESEPADTTNKYGD